MSSSVAATSLHDEEEQEQEEVEMSANDMINSLLDNQETSLRGAGRFLAHRHFRATITCNKFPRICRAKGSLRPNCCKKKCVNLSKDRLNCGKCGKKCKYSEICCKGKCVNILNDKNNCGGCRKKCHKGNKCVHGMCNYA
ncbi:stigma-specific STIG1-like protein 1 [Impatiens glandulifera]|uniref:stigma-specific STIG1-like protein 1 n=1 Tax=Impatiens glandulifera TaxID=253017 RepID=UPI001FB19A45|nr:stigma-specific STIG1-like protein 1 [Impatiens glandulifera]